MLPRLGEDAAHQVQAIAARGVRAASPEMRTKPSCCTGSITACPAMRTRSAQRSAVARQAEARSAARAMLAAHEGVAKVSVTGSVAWSG